MMMSWCHLLPNLRPQGVATTRTGYLPGSLTGVVRTASQSFSVSFWMKTFPGTLPILQGKEIVLGKTALPCGPWASAKTQFCHCDGPQFIIETDTKHRIRGIKGGRWARGIGNLLNYSNKMSNSWMPLCVKSL